MTTNRPYLEAHQSRATEPTPYEYRLAAVLEEIFSTAGHDLATVVTGLNERNVRTPGGGPWTEQSFLNEMRRLGA
jgi:hypothetical protein